MKISKKISNIRNDNNLTQEDLAEILGVSRQTVSNWENNKCYPDIATLILISEKFNVSFDNLIKEDEEMVKDIDKKIKSNKYKKIVIGIFITIFLLIAFYLGYKVFLLNYYDNGYNNRIYKNYFDNLEQITIEKNNDLANYEYYDLNVYIPKHLNQYSVYNDFRIGKETVISLYKYTSPFYEFYNTGEYYKNIDFEKMFDKADIYHPVDLIRYFEVLYDRYPNILWSRFNIELTYLMKNYIVSETEYGFHYYKRYYFCNNLNGIITVTDNNYEIEIYHEKDVYLIVVDKVYFDETHLEEILGSISFG